MRTTDMLTHHGTLPALALCLLLSACGGSGSSSSQPDPAPDPAPGPAPAPQPNVYDDFSAATISTARWLDQEFRRIPGSLILEQAFTGGGVARQDNPLAFASPSSIQSISVPVRIDIADVTDTVDNNGRVRFGIAGSWYNDGRRGPGATGDVTAEVRVVRNAGGNLQAEYVVSRCENADCSQFQDLVVTPAFAPVSLGQEHVLSISWDGAQLTFAVDQTSAHYPASGLPVAPSNQPFKQIRTRIERLGSPAESAHIRATARNVTVNGVEYDDFAATTLDPAKWLSHDFERGISNGSLHSRIASHNGQTANNSLRLINPAGVRKLGATVRILDAVNNGSEPRARLGGFWYHTGLGGGGATGELYGETAIIEQGGELRGRALLFRCEDANCVAGSVLLSDTDTLGVVTPDTAYPASIEWDGTRFEFKLGERALTHQPTGAGLPSGPSQTPQRLIGTRLLGDGSGSIHATFDDVVVERD
ncbi:MAG: hypothetical protein ACK4KV_20065 [Rhodocyclaceae bacterium]